MTLATLAWLDFAERDRRRMLDVVKLFREQETRDELGIGGVRDAFAELFFPGTSTIMTRARYFLLIPWLYRFREERAKSHTAKTPIPTLMRDYEIWMISRFENAGEHDGVIGIDARNKLQRLPSSVYWTGLGRWRIRRFEMSIAEYHRWLANMPPDADQVWRDDDGEPVAGFASQRWDPALPKPPDDWRDRLSFDLTRAEADYLRERILASCPGTLLAYLVDHASPVDASAGFVWMHPELATFPDWLRDPIEHARLASLVLQGAAWLYNVLLAEAQGSTDAAERYRSSMLDWAEELYPEKHAVRNWDLVRFWQHAHAAGTGIPRHTERFVSAWTDVVRDVQRFEDLVEDSTARDLIRGRERLLKRGRSRFENRRLLEIWSGPAGTGRLQYRWNPVVRDITNDILRGLSAGAGNDA